MVRTRSDLKQTQQQKELRILTKPVAIVSCAVNYGMRTCLLTVYSLAWQVADKLVVVRRLEHHENLVTCDAPSPFAVH